MAKDLASTYYPLKVKFKVLKNRIYKLSWMQHEREHIQLLTKSGCLSRANDKNIHADIRAAIVGAFEQGVVE
jgi:hypothetical protein